MPDDEPMPYFTVEEFRAKREYVNDEEVQALEDEEIEAARATAEEIIEGLDAEEGAHVAFVPRSETFTLSGCPLSIPRYRLRTIEALTIDGDDVDTDGLEIDGNVIRGLSWRGPVVVRVTHGWEAPPGRIKDAAILLTYHRAVKGPIDDRATGRLSPEGSVITIAVPGMRGAVTGIPEVDGAIGQYWKPRIRPLSVSVADHHPRRTWRDGI